MEIKIKFKDENNIRGTLSDISYDRFIKTDLYQSGSSDMAYDEYLRENNMVDLTDFNSQSTGDIELIVESENRGRVLKFKCVYDSDNDESFDERIYFKGTHGKFNIQNQLEKLLFSFGFKYIHTLGSYEHHFEKDGWQVIFNPDEEEFYLENINSDDSEFFRPASLNLGGDELILEKIESYLKEFCAK